ncbi:hypothetical protein D1872_257880 [compost metagenome]
MHNALTDDDILTGHYIPVLNKGAFDGMARFNQPFIVTDNSPGNFDGAFRIQLGSLNAADNTNIPGSTDFKTRQYIPADDDRADKIDISRTVVDVPVHFVNREYI